MISFRKVFALAIIMILTNHYIIAQAVGINNTNSLPNKHAILDISSTEKGLLIPRMTSDQRMALANKLSDTEVGMLIFDTDKSRFFFFNQVGFRLLNLNSEIIDSDQDTKITLEEKPDEDIIRFFTIGSERWRMNQDRLEPANNNGLVLIGKDAGLYNGSRKNNIAIGDSSLYFNGNGVEVGRAGNENIGIGKLSLYNNISGYQNVGLGTFSLMNNTSAVGNTAIGHNSLSFNTEGIENSALGQNALSTNRNGEKNTGIGANAMANIISGNHNVAVGEGAFSMPTDGDYNVALGWNALYDANNVNNNIAIGANAGRYNQINNTISIGDSALMNNGIGAGLPFHGLYNMAIGKKALLNNTQGSYNMAIGYESLATNTLGTSNTAIGVFSLKRNILGNGNTAVGRFSLSNNESGGSNTAIGLNALWQNETGDQNTAVGSNALTLNESGDRNVALGSYSARSLRNGNGNIAIGHTALYNNSIQSGNIAIGDSAMYSYNENAFINQGQIAIGFKSQRNLTTGRNNIAIGSFSLLSNNTGDNNTALGQFAMERNRGNDNTCIGYGTMPLNVGGDENTAVGSGTLEANTSRNRRTAVGYSANSIGNNGNNTGIGNDADCTAAHQVRIGNSDVTSIGGYANWTNISDGNFKKDVKEDVVGLDFIEKLRPVTYKLNMDAVYDFYEKNYGEDKRKRYEQESSAGTMVRSGFIAQEVAATAKRLGYDFSGVDAPKNKKDYYGLRYAEFVVPIVKAVQEQQEIINDQNKKIQSLENRLALLEKLVLQYKTESIN